MWMNNKVNNKIGNGSVVIKQKKTDSEWDRIEQKILGGQNVDTRRDREYNTVYEKE